MEGQFHGKIEAHFEKFLSGHWQYMIDDSTDVSSQAASERVRKRRRQNCDSQVTRAEKLAIIGELSATRQALESTGLREREREVRRMHPHKKQHPCAFRAEPTHIE